MFVFTKSSFQFLGIPPKGERQLVVIPCLRRSSRFQFLGIPPKGERLAEVLAELGFTGGFQFLGIPPKGELHYRLFLRSSDRLFPISRDPPEGGTVERQYTI